MSLISRNLAAAVLFELSLGLVAWAVAAAIGYQPATWWGTDEPWRMVGLGLCAALPMVLLLGAGRRAGAAWQELEARVRQLMAELFPQLSWTERIALGVAAGWGEEWLFRGLLQQIAGDLLGPGWGTVAACLVVSVLFGAAHALSPLYFAVATLAGLYLGTLSLQTGSLLPAIVAHASYDIVALWYYRSREPSTTAN